MPDHLLIVRLQSITTDTRGGGFIYTKEKNNLKHNFSSSFEFIWKSGGLWKTSRK